MTRSASCAARMFGCAVLFHVLSIAVTALTHAAGPANPQADRSPVDLVLTADEKWLLTANQTSDSVSLVRVADGVVASEIDCGQRPAAIALLPDGYRALVTTSFGGDVVILAIDGQQLRVAGKVHLGFEPTGVAVSPDGRLAYVALAAANAVGVVDLNSLEVVSRIAVGRWPRYLALTPDGTRLAVGCSGDGGMSVVDTQAREKLYDSKFLGLNIGHVQTSSDGQYAYFPWMVYADRPITSGNIREGWVLGNRLARVRLDGPARREALAIDPRGRAVADPHGLAVSPAGDWVAVSASGTHELAFFRLGDLPLRSDGPGDHLAAEIARDDQRFFRVPLGGRPMGIRFDRSGTRVFAANYLSNAVQIVNVKDRRVEREIALGGPAQQTLARRGEAIFHDAGRSPDGWYSCHSCHYDGGTNAVTMDTKNDGSFGTYKMVLSLRNLPRTGPWFWHGWETDLHRALGRSLAETMQGPAASDEDVQALAAYLGALKDAPNPYRLADGRLSAGAERGKQVFASAAANCAACHRGPYFTDGEIHDAGLGSEFDKYEGYNTPSLVGIANRAAYLHHGRARTLDELLSDLHSPSKVSGTRELTAEERADLVDYLRSL
jgi:DNA-binding beta-propeller fold protein YncE